MHRVIVKYPGCSSALHHVHAVQNETPGFTGTPCLRVRMPLLNKTNIFRCEYNCVDCWVIFTDNLTDLHVGAELGTGSLALGGSRCKGMMD